MNLRFLLVASISLVACTQDTGVAVHNSPPDVSFVLPADGSWAYSGVPMEFVATITDDHTPNEDLTFAWTSTLDGYIVGEEVVEGETLSMIVAEGLSVGEHVISLQVVDGDGETAEDTLTVESIRNHMPTLSFIKPQQNSVLAAGDVVQVVAYVQDEEDTDNLDLLEFVWEGTIDLTDAPLYGDSTGRARFDVSGVSEGNHSLSVEVFDLAGDSSTAGVSFSVE